MNDARPATAALAVSAGLLTVAAMSRSDWPIEVLAVLFVITSIAVTSVVSSSMTWATTSVGAVSALAFWALLPGHVQWAYWLLLLSWLLPRSFRTRTALNTLIHAIISIALSYVVAWLFIRYMNQSIQRHLASAVFAGAILSFPLLLFSDSPVSIRLLRNALPHLGENVRPGVEKLLERVETTDIQISAAQLRALHRALDSEIAKNDGSTQQLLREIRAVTSSSSTNPSTPSQREDEPPASMGRTKEGSTQTDTEDERNDDSSVSTEDSNDSASP